MMTKDEAKVLQDRVNTILEEARKEPDDVRYNMGAINWGDLDCIGVELRRSLLNDDEGLIVAIVEEASPDANGLQDHIREKLKSDYPNVWVETEW